MKTMNALSAALGLAAALAGSPAWADVVPLFSFAGQQVLAPPAFGTSIGTVVVDDGSLSGTGPGTASTRQLLIDSQGVGDYGAILGVFSIGLPGSFSMSAYQYSFSVAALTTLQFSYNFLTNTDPAAPETFEVFSADLFEDGTSNETSLALEATGISAFVDSPSFYALETGIKNVEFTVDPGSYTAQFLVVTNQTGCIIPSDPLGCVPSAALLNPIPEPTTLALVGLTLLGVMAPRRRQQAAD